MADAKRTRKSPEKHVQRRDGGTSGKQHVHQITKIHHTHDYPTNGTDSAMRNISTNAAQKKRMKPGKPTPVP
jgi:hypothetical protein